MEAFTLLSIVIIMDIQETITQVIETVTQTIVARAAHILRLSNHNMVGFLSLSSFQVVICLILILWVHHLQHTKALSLLLPVMVSPHQTMEATHQVMEAIHLISLGDILLMRITHLTKLHND